MKPNVLEVRNLTHEFRNPFLRVIEDVTFAMGSGEFLSIIGPSGCGKTTLLSLIAELRKHTSGEIKRNFNGVLSCVFQDPLLLPWKTVRENALFGLKALGMKRDADADRLLGDLGLTAFAQYYPHEISRGMQQRVSLARALVLNPSLLLLDEPLSSLDAIARRAIQELMLSMIAKFSQSTILVTHSAEEAIYCSDRILIFSPRPARIIRVVPVPFPRPRWPEIRATREFRSLEESIYATIQDSAH